MILRMFFTAGLLLIPPLVYWRDWKYPDRRKRFSQRFSRIIFGVWIACAVGAVRFLWHDSRTSARMQHALDDASQRIRSLEAQVTEYRNEVGPRPFDEIEPIVRWGVAPPNRIELILDTASLSHYARQYHVLAVCRVRDDTVDFFADTQLLVSSPYRIHGSRAAIHFLMPEYFLARLMSTSLSVQCRAALLPHGIDVRGIHSVSDIIGLGGIVHPRSRGVKTALKPLR